MRERKLYGIPKFDWESLAKECGLEHPPPCLLNPTANKMKGNQTDGNVTS